jgi:acyl carrier protein
MELLEKKQLLADLFDVEIEEIQENTILDDFDPWDSMTKLSLIVMMDDECGKKLTGEKILEFKTIKDIIDFM